MRIPIWLLAAIGTLALAACAGDVPVTSAASGASPASPGASMPRMRAVPAELDLDRVRPMPSIEVRVERLMAETANEPWPPMTLPETWNRGTRRALLASLAPSTRAAMRRHQVRIEAVARHLAGGTQ